jgi:hypothetical protein
MSPLPYKVQHQPRRAASIEAMSIFFIIAIVPTQIVFFAGFVMSFLHS